MSGWEALAVEATGSEPAFPFSQSVRFSILYNTQTNTQWAPAQKAQQLRPFSFASPLHFSHVCMCVGSPVPLDGHMITECENTPK